MLAALAPSVSTWPPGCPPAPVSALSALLASGAIDAREHAAALAYRVLRARFETACRSARKDGAGLAMTEAAWFALKRRHEAVIGAAGFDRFLLDRVVLDDEAPLRCEVERVGAALGRVAEVCGIGIGEACNESLAANGSTII